MKKVLVCLLSIAFVLAMGGIGFAKVSGPCVNCHTMHNSQGGPPPSPLWFLGGGPRGALVANSCEGCHTTAGGDPLAEGTGGGQFPYVLDAGNAFNDNNCLAGGYFPGLQEKGGSGSSNTGNAHTIGSVANPPGYNGSWYNAVAGLSCAGSSGCHGDQSIADPMKAVSGGHHGTSITGYRMLIANNSGIPENVAGTGATDYEEALIKNTSTASTTTNYTAAGKHNLYKAVKDGTDTISQFCANCHGDFHADTKVGAWYRHPTDIILPSDWQLQGSGGYTLNDKDLKYNPPGYNGTEGGAGTRYATCLSCHRAHGTDNYDLLRFAYNPNSPYGETTDQQAGSGKAYGCLGCHNKQR